MFWIIRRFRPVPNASIRLMATVPQMIPKTVRNVRSFSVRTSRKSWRRTSLSVLIVGRFAFWRLLCAGIGCQLSVVSSGPCSVLPVGLPGACVMFAVPVSSAQEVWTTDNGQPTTTTRGLRNLLGRPLHYLLALLQSGDDLDVQAVRDAGLDLRLLRLG